MQTNLYLKRQIFTDNSTIGDLYWEGGEFETNTLEDTCRRRSGPDGVLQLNEKIFGETAIPSGRYEIQMAWSEHFKRKMPFLLNVPFFTGIMFHWGNSPKDTFGCILVGHEKLTSPDWVESSMKSYNQFEPKIIAALEKGRLFISIDGGYAADAV